MISYANVAYGNERANTSKRGSDSTDGNTKAKGVMCPKNTKERHDNEIAET